MDVAGLQYRDLLTQFGNTSLIVFRESSRLLQPRDVRPSAQTRDFTADPRISGKERREMVLLRFGLDHLSQAVANLVSHFCQLRQYCQPGRGKAESVRSSKVCVDAGAIEDIHCGELRTPLAINPGDSSISAILGNLDVSLRHSICVSFTGIREHLAVAAGECRASERPRITRLSGTI